MRTTLAALHALALIMGGVILSPVIALGFVVEMIWTGYLIGRGLGARAFRLP